jgi:uracil-DNA glycosylase
MKRVRLISLNDFAEWRLAARALLLQGIHPEDVAWEDPAASVDLFAEPEERPADVATRAVGVVPPRFLELAEAAICHREAIRFGLLYRLLFRLQKDREIIDARSDPDISKLYRLATDVRRDSEKMKGLIGFGEAEGRFAVWHEPAHYTLERTAPFFVRRLPAMQWAIFTPYRSAAWTGRRLILGAGVRKRDAPLSNATEGEWRSYFASVFNAGGGNLPGTTLIPSMIAGAKQAEHEMVTRQAAEIRQIETREIDAKEAAEITSLAAARAAVQGCTRCPLYEHATQAVFGEGPQSAEVMFVGEQPGDQEDLAGKPFVGPAGQVFDKALDTVGIDRRRVYVTNAVKHFKFEPRGKKRIHSKPNSGEIQACRFWVNLEREFVRPKLIVALGATAVQSLMGKAASISSLRGKKIELPDGGTLLVTVHPSYLLRMPDREKAAEELKRFEADLRTVKAFIDRRGDDVRSGGPLAA